MTNAAYTVSTAWAVTSKRKDVTYTGNDEEYYATRQECEAFINAAIETEKQLQDAVHVQKTLDHDGWLVVGVSANTVTTRMFTITR